MVIANACGHPDCEAERAVLNGQIKGWILDYEALEAKCEFWQKLANERSAELIRLTAELEAMRDELAKGGKS